MDIHTVTSYVSENTIPTQIGRKCVDGRYQDDENTGMIARAGGDLGYVMALLSLSENKDLGLSPVDCFEKVNTVLKEMGEIFYAHSDEHAVHGSTIIGCGHASKPTTADLATKYSVNASGMATLVEYVKSLAQKDSQVKIMVLPGDHKEEGVLVVTGTKMTVRPQDGEHMFFMYDKTRDDAFMEQLVGKMELESVTFEEFRKISDLQLGATLELLAKGMPIYEVNVDGESPSVILQGTV